MNLAVEEPKFVSMITSIKIDEESFRDFMVVEGESENLDNLNRINIFIGSNNSGKSRFLRSLLKNTLAIRVSESDTQDLSSSIFQLKKELNSYLKQYLKSSSVTTLNDQVSKLPDTLYNTTAEQITGALDALEKLTQVTTNTSWESNTGYDPRTFYEHVRERARFYSEKIKVRGIVYKDEYFKFIKTYIPILRGLRPIQISDEGYTAETDNFCSRTISDYQITHKANELTVHTGLDLYKTITGLLLGDHDERLLVTEFERFLSATFFNNDPIHIVPRIGKDVLYIKIGDEKQFPIYDLGEGIQSIILLTYPLFFNRGKRILYFIEEPEIHLHPGLERIFIETLRKPEFSTYQYFITTHSNHFLDLTLEYDDISVYSFRKSVEDGERKFLIKNVNSNHKQILDLLGVRNSSVFLSNCTIWVEGITDRLYIRKYLEIIQKENSTNYREDYHYSFIEYAGNNITHWSFLESEDEEYSNINVESICSKIFLIADNDGVDLPSKRKKEKKKERQEQLRQKLGENFYLTKGMEIENLLKKDIIKKVILEMEGDQDKLDFSSFDRTINDHTKQYLGDFITKYVGGFKKKYCSDYGTIHDKISFCKRAVSQITSINDMSNEAIELTNQILKFIRDSQ